MPIPKPENNENSQKFVGRCMSNETMKKEYPDAQQRIAICLGQTKKKSTSILSQVLDVLGLSFEYGCEECEDGEEITSANFIEPLEQDYIDCNEQSEAAEYQGRKVTLNKPFRTSEGPKKFAVYTKNEKGNIVLVRFGDPNMKIKKNIPERRKSFRARHNCDNPGPKWKARYWSCKAW